MCVYIINYIYIYIFTPPPPDPYQPSCRLFSHQFQSSWSSSAGRAHAMSHCATSEAEGPSGPVITSLGCCITVVASLNCYVTLQPQGLLRHGRGVLPKPLPRPPGGSKRRSLNGGCYKVPKLGDLLSRSSRGSG